MTLWRNPGPYTAPPEPAPFGMPVADTMPRPGGQHIPFARQLAFLACLTPMLLPVTWVTGTTLLWVLLIAVANLFCWRRPTSVEWAFIAVCALLALGLMVGKVTGMPQNRVFSAVYHLMHGFILVAFVNLGRTIMSGGVQGKLSARLMQSIFISFCIMIVYMYATALYVASAPLESIRIPTLIFGKLGIGVLEAYNTIPISKVNPISSGLEWRLAGFGVWATEGAYLTALVGLLATIYAFTRFGLKALIAVELLTLFAVYLTGGRTVMVAYMASFAVLAVLVGRHWKTVLVIAAPVILGVLAFFVYGLDYLMARFAEANEYRGASSGTRFTSYILSFGLTMDQNPLTGLGYTPFNKSQLGVPIGSHSSWTSIFIRGGLAAILAFITMQALLLSRVATTAIRMVHNFQTAGLANTLPMLVLSRAVLITVLWWVTEDFDGSAAAAALSGLLIGVFLETSRQFAISSSPPPIPGTPQAQAAAPPPGAWR